MIKSELTTRICEKNPHLYRRDVERIIQVVIDEIIGALAKGARVELRGFGAFSLRKRKARIGRNPRTGERVQVEAKSMPLFRMSRKLYERLNSAGLNSAGT